VAKDRAAYRLESVSIVTGRHRNKSLLQRALSIYEVNAPLIEQLRPDLILTQDQCAVCAVSLDDLRKALPNGPEILSVSPRRMIDVWKDIQAIADAAGVGRGRPRVDFAAEDSFCGYTEAVRVHPFKATRQDIAE
jgi:iron complex transport system substrate-binding protein